MIFQPLNLATKPNYGSPSSIDNATLIACGNATRNNRFVHILKPEWNGIETRNNNVSPHKGYTAGNSPDTVANVLSSMTLPPNSLIKVRKPAKSKIYCSEGVNGAFTAGGTDPFVTVCKIAYSD